ncbi:MAG: NAD(P)H-dependent oxidoreductase [Anaerolineales bacterium]|nr:NAD(P)H-dependent oxidoreductase [Anaerolineales bacterium]
MNSATQNEAIHVVGLVGSLRRGSYNRLLMELAQRVAPEGMTIELFDLDDLPLYNGDIDNDNDRPQAAIALHRAVEQADALLFATPEYNHSVPAVLKNAIDWLSRPQRGGGTPPIWAKPTAIMGAATGMWGTIRAQKHLRSILAATNTPVVMKPDVLVRNVKSLVVEGRIDDESTEGFVHELLENLAELTWRHQREYNA